MDYFVRISLLRYRCGLGNAGFVEATKVLGGATVILVAFLAIFFLQNAMFNHLPWPWELDRLFGKPKYLLRFITIFFIGGYFFLFKDKIKFSPILAWLSICGILAIRFAKPEHIEVVLVIFGGYLLFYFGSIEITSLSWMAKVPDLSYGIYLFGWPVESFLIWRFHPSPWIVFVLATIICFCLAWLSWTFVEKPALLLKGKRMVSLKHSTLLAEASV